MTRTRHLHLDHRDTVSNPVFYDRHSFVNAVQAFRYRLARLTPPCNPRAEFAAVLRTQVDWLVELLRPTFKAPPLTAQAATAWI